MMFFSFKIISFFFFYFIRRTAITMRTFNPSINTIGGFFIYISMDEILNKLSDFDTQEFKALIEDFELTVKYEDEIIKCDDADLFGCLKL